MGLSGVGWRASGDNLIGNGHDNGAVTPGDSERCSSEVRADDGVTAGRRRSVRAPRIVCKRLRMAIDRQQTRGNEKTGGSDRGQMAQAEAGESRPDTRGRGNAAANRPLRQRGGTKL